VGIAINAPVPIAVIRPYEAQFTLRIGEGVTFNDIILSVEPTVNSGLVEDSVLHEHIRKTGRITTKRAT
jgi:hypothetical protein